MNFTPLASSSEGCSYLLGSGNLSKLLIDAGIKFEDIQKGTNYQITDLAGCLISHAHGDHVKAVTKLLRAGVDCYASRETWTALNQPIFSRVKEIKAGTVYEAGGWKFKPFNAVHDSPGTYGFLITDGKSKLLYLTDSAYSLHKFQGLTHIAIECNFSEEILRQNQSAGDIEMNRFKRVTRTHMSIERLEELLKANDLSKVQEIHLLHLSDANSNEEEFKTRIQKLTGKPVYVAQKKVAS